MPASRILIDCSFIDFVKQPTGIPRTVLKYIEVGYGWGGKAGIEVIPIVPTREGVFICRPLPGRAPPTALRDQVSVEPSRLLNAIYIASNLTYYYFKDIVHHVLGLVAAIFRFRAVRSLSTLFEGVLVSMLDRPRSSLTPVGRGTTE